MDANDLDSVQCSISFEVASRNAEEIPFPVDSSREVIRMFYAGIDIAKRKHEVSIIDKAGPFLNAFPSRMIG